MRLGSTHEKFSGSFTHAYTQIFSTSRNKNVTETTPMILEVK